MVLFLLDYLGDVLAIVGPGIRPVLRFVCAERTVRSFEAD
jgi:hypothetical protein